MTQCKRNRFNPITLPRENVQNMVRFCCFRPTSTYSNNSAHFGRFLRTWWSDWSDSFCIVPGVLRHKFRVPTTYYCENFEFPLIGGPTPLWGGLKNGFLQKQKLFPSSLNLRSPNTNCAKYIYDKRGGMSHPDLPCRPNMSYHWTLANPPLGKT